MRGRITSKVSRKKENKAVVTDGRNNSVEPSNDYNDISSLINLLHKSRPFIFAADFDNELQFIENVESINDHSANATADHNSRASDSSILNHVSIGQKQSKLDIRQTGLLTHIKSNDTLENGYRSKPSASPLRIYSLDGSGSPRAPYDPTSSSQADLTSQNLITTPFNSSTHRLLPASPFTRRGVTSNSCIGMGDEDHPNEEEDDVAVYHVDDIEDDDGASIPTNDDDMSFLNNKNKKLKNTTNITKNKSENTSGAQVKPSHKVSHEEDDDDHSEEVETRSVSTSHKSESESDDEEEDGWLQVGRVRATRPAVSHAPGGGGSVSSLPRSKEHPTLLYMSSQILVVLKPPYWYCSDPRNGSYEILLPADSSDENVNNVDNNDNNDNVTTITTTSNLMFNSASSLTVSNQNTSFNPPHIMSSFNRDAPISSSSLANNCDLLSTPLLSKMSPGAPVSPCVASPSSVRDPLLLRLRCQELANSPRSESFCAYIAARWGHLIDPKVLRSLELQRGLCHRLDRDTSGPLLVARTPAAWKFVRRIQRMRAVGKEYLLLVHGRPQTDFGLIDTPLMRKGKSMAICSASTAGALPSLTCYKVLGHCTLPLCAPHLAGCSKDLSFVWVKLITGRTHQIRVHMAQSLGCPLVGDFLYSDEKYMEIDSKWCRRLFLHCQRLIFNDPCRPSWPYLMADAHTSVNAGTYISGNSCFNYDILSNMNENNNNNTDQIYNNTSNTTAPTVTSQSLSSYIPQTQNNTNMSNNNNNINNNPAMTMTGGVYSANTSSSSQNILASSPLPSTQQGRLSAGFPHPPHHLQAHTTANTSGSPSMPSFPSPHVSSLLPIPSLASSLEDVPCHAPDVPVALPLDLQCSLRRCISFVENENLPVVLQGFSNDFSNTPCIRLCPLLPSEWGQLVEAGESIGCILPEYPNNAKDVFAESASSSSDDDERETNRKNSLDRLISSSDEDDEDDDIQTALNLNTVFPHVLNKQRVGARPSGTSTATTAGHLSSLPSNSKHVYQHATNQIISHVPIQSKMDGKQQFHREGVDMLSMKHSSSSPSTPPITDLPPQSKKAISTSVTSMMPTSSSSSTSTDSANRRMRQERKSLLSQTKVGTLMQNGQVMAGGGEIVDMSVFVKRERALLSLVERYGLDGHSTRVLRSLSWSETSKIIETIQKSVILTRLPAPKRMANAGGCVNLLCEMSEKAAEVVWRLTVLTRAKNVPVDDE